MTNNCDCLSYCGDDPDIKKGIAVPCNTYNAEMASVARAGALSNIDALLAQHSLLLESNSYCYFELAYTRTTGWMAFICDKPAGEIITSGQGDTPNAACANALLALGVPA